MEDLAKAASAEIARRSCEQANRCILFTKFDRFPFVSKLLALWSTKGGSTRRQAMIEAGCIEVCARVIQQGCESHVVAKLIAMLAHLSSNARALTRLTDCGGFTVLSDIYEDSLLFGDSESNQIQQQISIIFTNCAHQSEANGLLYAYDEIVELANSEARKLRSLPISDLVRNMHAASHSAALLCAGFAELKISATEKCAHGGGSLEEFIAQIAEGGAFDLIVKSLRRHKPASIPEALEFFATLLSAKPLAAADMCATRDIASFVDWFAKSCSLAQLFPTIQLLNASKIARYCVSATLIPKFDAATVLSQGSEDLSLLLSLIPQLIDIIKWMEAKFHISEEASHLESLVHLRATIVWLKMLPAAEAYQETFESPQKLIVDALVYLDNITLSDELVHVHLSVLASFIQNENVPQRLKIESIHELYGRLDRATINLDTLIFGYDLIPVIFSAPFESTNASDIEYTSAALALAARLSAHEKVLKNLYEIEALSQLVQLLFSQAALTARGFAGGFEILARILGKFRRMKDLSACLPLFHAVLAGGYDEKNFIEDDLENPATIILRAVCDLCSDEEAAHLMLAAGMLPGVVGHFLRGHGNADRKGTADCFELITHLLYAAGAPSVLSEIVEPAFDAKSHSLTGRQGNQFGKLARAVAHSMKSTNLDFVAPAAMRLLGSLLLAGDPRLKWSPSATQIEVDNLSLGQSWEATEEDVDDSTVEEPQTLASVLEVLKFCRIDVEATIHGCKALSIFTQKCERGGRSVARFGGVKILLFAMRTHIRNSDVQIYVLRILRDVALTSDGCRKLMIRDGATAMIVAALRRHDTEAHIQANGGTCLAELVLASNDGASSLLTVTDGIEALVHSFLLSINEAPSMTARSVETVQALIKMDASLAKRIERANGAKFLNPLKGMNEGIVKSI